MKKKDLENYIYEMHRQGLSDSQIARRLNASVEELAKILNGEEEKKPVETAVKALPKKRPHTKKASGVPSTEADVKTETEEAPVEEPKIEEVKIEDEDLSWMED